MPRNLSRFYPLLLGLGLWICLPLQTRGQDEDLRYQVVEVKGKVTAYRDETDETTRLRMGQKVDDGDKITTDAKSEVVLRLKGRAYVHLSPRTKIVISRLRINDAKEIESRVNLVTGRILTQLDRVQPPGYVVTARKMSYRAHGTLFEVSRKKELIYVTAYQGVVVANFPARSEIVKERQVMKIEGGRFRYVHYLKNDDEARLEEWESQLAEITKKHKTGSR